MFLGIGAMPQQAEKPPISPSAGMGGLGYLWPQMYCLQVLKPRKKTGNVMEQLSFDVRCKSRYKV